MPRFWLWLVIIGTVVLQTTVMPFLQVGNIRPDLPLMVTVSMSLIFGREAGITVGFFSGLLWDLLTAQFFGMHTLAKLITGYAVGSFEKKVFKENPILPMAAIFLATFAHELVLYVCAHMLEIKAPLFLLMGRIMGPTAVFNTLVMPFVYFAILRFSSVLWSKERQMTEI